MSGTNRRGLLSRELYEALVKADVLRRGDKIHRIIIDAQWDDLVRIHIQRTGDDRLIEVIGGLTDAEIVDPARPEPQSDITWAEAALSGAVLGQESTPVETETVEGHA